MAKEQFKNVFEKNSNFFHPSVRLFIKTQLRTREMPPWRRRQLSWTSEGGRSQIHFEINSKRNRHKNAYSQQKED